MDQFRSYVTRVLPDQFLFYESKSLEKRLEFQSLIRAIGVNLKGMRFLDIGPGYGDALDVCFENGASGVEFVETDPFFFTYNRLKGFTKGHEINHKTRLGTLHRSQYDFIWVKGSISPDNFIFRLNPDAVNKILLSHWLSQVEHLAKPHCQIIICPYWLHHAHKRRTEDLQRSFFTETMLERGYDVLPGIENHNREPDYPVTFHKVIGVT
ncbi:MAG TPA: hypothetical protein VL126_15310 [Bacteroidota bacterium]|nr:hypothetical protein [Bacteroidota bacterium]